MLSFKTSILLLLTVFVMVSSDYLVSEIFKFPDCDSVKGSGHKHPAVRSAAAEVQDFKGLPDGDQMQAAFDYASMLMAKKM